MKRDFGAELKQIIQNVNHVKPLAVVRYNIHKRSLPVGLDKVVVFDVTRSEALWWIEHRLQSVVYFNEITESKQIIYYDVVPTDATNEEKSVFYNVETSKKEVRVTA